MPGNRSGSGSGGFSGGGLGGMAYLPECDASSITQNTSQSPRWSVRLAGLFARIGTMKSITALEETAYHEAGHVVMAWFCGHTVGGVTIRPDHDGGTLGRMLHDEYGEASLGHQVQWDREHGTVIECEGGTYRLPTETEAHWYQIVADLDEMTPHELDTMVAVAGEAAERRINPDTHPDHAASDREWNYEARVAIGKDTGESDEVIWSRLSALASQLFDDPMVWRTIEAVALALFERID